MKITACQQIKVIFTILPGLHQYLKLLIAAVLGAITSLPVNAQIIINTDLLTIDGIGSGGTYAGAQLFTVTAGPDIAYFLLGGDFNVAGQTINLVGNRTAKIVVFNNADLTGTTINLSPGVSGGGDGGLGGAGGTGGTGGVRGISGAMGAGGAGGIATTVSPS